MSSEPALLGGLRIFLDQEAPVSKRRATTKRRRSLYGGIFLLVLAPLWFLVAPPSLGGSSRYVVTSGSSMAPLFHSGDLAILREAPRYRVGDIVAYRDPNLEKVVLHRIVALDGGRYVLQGDNNDFLDPHHPARSSFLGKLWVRVPRAGSLLGWMGTPRNAAIAGVILGLFLMGSFTGARARRRRRGHEQEDGAPRPRGPRIAPRWRPLAGLAARRALAVFSISTVLFMALGALAFSRPLDISSARDVAYGQIGAFSYSASGPRGPVYGGRPLSAGDPVFLRIIDHVRVAFRYRLDAGSPHSATGTIRMDAELRDPSGWAHRIAIAPPTDFQGDEATISGTIDLTSLQQLIAKVQRQTEIPQSQYSLILTADVRIDGTLVGQSMTDAFSPALSFVLDPHVLRVATPGSTSVGAPAADPLASSSGGSVSVPGTRAGRLRALGQGLSVATARHVALWGVVASLVGLLTSAVLSFVWRPKDEPARIGAKFGNRMISVEGKEQAISGAAIDVTTPQDLVTLADTYDGTILHQEWDGVHTYLVAAGVVVYRYRSPREGPPSLPIGDRHSDPSPPADRSSRPRRGQPHAGHVAGAAARSVPYPTIASSSAF